MKCGIDPLCLQSIVIHSDNQPLCVKPKFTKRSGHDPNFLCVLIVKILKIHNKIHVF